MASLALDEAIGNIIKNEKNINQLYLRDFAMKQPIMELKIIKHQN